jgi:hypothetical protein
VHSKDEFRNAAAIWLEIQYGWRPLLNDIYESAQEIVKATDQSPRKVRTASGSTYYDFSEKYATINATDRIKRLEKKVISVKGVYTVWYTTPDTPRTLSQLGFINPAYLAWELTPFSFVIDWFLPIGNALNALDATMGLSFDKGCYSQTIESSRRTVGTGITNSTHVTQGTATSFYMTKQFQRSKISTFPTVNFPDFKNPLSVEHALNSIALLIQIFSGKSS